MAKKTQKREIIWNIVNSGLAGLLVLLGAFTAGNITLESICGAVAAAFVVAIIQFKEYWAGEQGEYSAKLFTFMK